MKGVCMLYLLASLVAARNVSAAQGFSGPPQASPAQSARTGVGAGYVAPRVVERCPPGEVLTAIRDRLNFRQKDLTARENKLNLEIQQMPAVVVDLRQQLALKDKEIAALKEEMEKLKNARKK